MVNWVRMCCGRRFGGAQRFIKRLAQGWIAHAAATGALGHALAGTLTAAGSYRQAFDPATYSRAARDAQDRIDDIKIPCAHSLCQAPQGVVLVVTSAAAIQKRDLPKISCVASRAVGCKALSVATRRPRVPVRMI